MLADVLANDVDVVEEALRRARRLVEAVAELVDLLATPSRLGQRARQLAESWPDGGPSPSFRVDGQAWIAAAASLRPVLDGASTEQAWRQAWLLLAEELAEDSLSPFSVINAAAEAPGGAGVPIRVFTSDVHGPGPCLRTRRRRIYVAGTDAPPA